MSSSALICHSACSCLSDSWRFDSSANDEFNPYGSCRHDECLDDQADVLSMGLGIGGLPRLDHGFMNFTPKSMGGVSASGGHGLPHMLSGMPSSMESSPDSCPSGLDDELLAPSPNMSRQKLTADVDCGGCTGSCGTSSASVGGAG